MATPPEWSTPRERTTGESVEESSLLIGKQVTPRLFIRYALGLFKKGDSIRLNYLLTPKLSLEAESSGQSSWLDLIHRFDRERLGSP